MWNITHAINSALFLLAHTAFNSATLYHAIGKQVTPKTAISLLESHLTISVEFTIASIYFWEELPFYQPTVYCSDQKAGKQYLILQHNLAPILYTTAAGETAPAWQKPQSCNTHKSDNPGCNAVEALGWTGALCPFAYIRSVQLHWSQVPDKILNSQGCGKSTLIHRFKGHATTLTHQSLSRCHSIHHQSLLPHISGKKQLLRDWRNLKQKPQQLQPIQ